MIIVAHDSTPIWFAYCSSFAQSEDGPLPGWPASLFYLLALKLHYISLADNPCIALLVLMLLTDAEAFLIKNTCPSLRPVRLLWTCHPAGLPLDNCRKGAAEASGIITFLPSFIITNFHPKRIFTLPHSFSCHFTYPPLLSYFLHIMNFPPSLFIFKT